MPAAELVRETRLAEFRERLAGWRKAGQRIALVPTMGNLHAGHLSLVSRARQVADRVVTSIFVNPAQFGPGEDFERYPRTLAADIDQLERIGCDLAWLPGQTTMYPHDSDSRIQLGAPPDLAGILCGASRPGHFDGVVTVVLRLFNQCQPDVALFGEKDFQQLAIIRRLVSDLSLPVIIDAGPIRRETDGLAMSSRNGYLDTRQRARAPELYRTLQWVAARIGADGTEIRAACQAGRERLQAAGLRPDYVQVRRAGDLGLPGEAGEEGALRVFGAAWLGGTRLIDNLAV